MSNNKPNKGDIIQLYSEIDDSWYTGRVKDPLSSMFTCRPVKPKGRRKLGSHMFLFYKDLGVTWKWVNKDSSSYGETVDAFGSGLSEQQYDDLWKGVDTNE